LEIIVDEFLAVDTYTPTFTRDHNPENVGEARQRLRELPRIQRNYEVCIKRVQHEVSTIMLDMPGIFFYWEKIKLRLTAAFPEILAEMVLLKNYLSVKNVETENGTSSCQPEQPTDGSTSIPPRSKKVRTIWFLLDIMEREREAGRWNPRPGAELNKYLEALKFMNYKQAPHLSLPS
jgi:hypothetical protein